MSGRRSILIVDDNFVNRQILYKILSEDYDIFQAENGEQAMSVLKANSNRISAVLLDLVMPIMDGYSFLQKQQLDIAVQSIPVIVTTQKEEDETEEKALSMGACDFLTKPYKPSIIKHRIANTIRLRETATFINTVEHDKLTGVYSKEFFYKKAEEILFNNPGENFDLICVDIERFKVVNDLFGTEEGDNLLKHLTQNIKDRVGDAGISGRLGPDTFVSLIHHRTDYCKEMFLECIRDLNEYPLNIDLTLRYGIYEIDDIAVPLNMMCDRAKLAIESIKGKYDVYYSFYDQSIRSRMLAEQAITNNMKQALSKNQFKVYYQPKYDLITERIIGAEALVRWEHPENGFMSPDDFIPLFEKNGFITDLDMYVWEAVCKEMVKIQAMGIKVPPISVNVSRVDIYNPNLTEILIALLKKYDLEAKYLHLEITESAYTENPKQLIEVVSTLKNVGFVIEMDDFGTGYSSLNMLNELPIDMLKLDMRFLQNKAGTSDNNIVSFIISLAKWMNLEVVAEGVETQEQVIMLRNMDCHYAQGYYYARPMPQDDFEKLLKLEGESLQDIEQYIPLLHIKAKREEPIDIQQDGYKKTMLVVDDMETNRAILMEIFKDEYNVVEAKNGEYALKYLLANPTEVGIVLLDLLMPVMDGFQTLEHMKNNVILKNIPVIITSQAGEGSEARALHLGAADFIGKPYNPDVAVRRVTNVMADVNLKKFEGEYELKKTLYEMQSIMDTIPGGIATYKLYNDGDVEMLYCNDGFCDIIGYTYLEYNKLGSTKNGLRIVYDDDSSKLIAEVRSALSENRNVDCFFRIRHKLGEIVWIHITGIQVQQDEESHTYHCVIANMTQEQRVAELLKIKAEMDALTGVYNLAKFKSRLEKHFRNDSDAPAFFILLKVDNIKQIDSTLGAAKVDSILQKVAQKLKKSFNQTDDIGRVGSDIFAVLMQGYVEPDELKWRLSKLPIGIGIGLDGVEDELETRISIGVCRAPMDGCDFNTLYKNADSAMTIARKSGKNQYKMFSAEIELANYPINQNMEWLLDETQDMVFVCDENNYNILYMNRAAEKEAKKNKPSNGEISKKCHSIMWGKDEPCEHCNFIQVEDNELHEKEVYVKELGKTYNFKGRRIDWNGKKALVQFVHENEPKNISAEVKRQVGKAQVLESCVARLASKADIMPTLSEILSAISEYYQAQRGFILVMDNKTQIAKKVISFERVFKKGQNIVDKFDVSQFNTWVAKIDNCETILVNDIMDLKQTSPEEYSFCIKLGILNSRSACFKVSENFNGCIGVYNAEKNIDDIAFLENIAYLIKGEITKLYSNR